MKTWLQNCSNSKAGTRRTTVVFTWICLCIFVASIIVAGAEAEWFKPFNVTYDHRALVIDGHRRMLISAGIHYPRATPEMWPDLIAKAKEGGVDVIETYVFWNGHEPVKGQYNFEGRYDLVKFAKLVASNGLYFFLRIGPYACAEWNFGGFPVWLRDIPGIEFRTNNVPFKEEMKRFVSKVVNLMREEMLFSWQGGPIILLQIENEYGNLESSYGNEGKEYVKWAASMALSLGAGVPWVMCKQPDAPYDIIDTCNAYYCDGFKPNSRNKPIFWTENWDGWYTQWGERLPHRPVEDLAFAVARFFQRGGSLQNYYMYFGGTNFGRTAGGPLQITSYDYDAPIDEYGLLNEPKWGHLKDLHAALKLCEPALVAADSPTYIKLGSKQEAHVYQENVHREGLNLSLSQISNKCSVFLANIDERKSATVTFRGQTYTLPPWSVSILPDCRSAIFNTAKVGAQTSVKLVGSDLPVTSNLLLAQQLVHHNGISHISKSWKTTKEPINIWSNNSFTAEGIWEHLNVTKDQSDYLWYSTRIYVSDGDILFWKENAAHPKLAIDSVRDILRVFVNGQLIGNVVGHWVKAVQTLQFQPGYNDLTLLSQTVGLQNYGAFIEKDGAGIRGTIKITGFENGHIDLSKSLWTYQVGLQGEFLKFYNEESENAGWVELTPDAIPSTFTWYKTYFDVPNGNDPVALDLESMGKGQAWVNGHHIGRYWTRVSPKSGCQEICDYRGAYDSDKCTTNCGKPTQTLYHVPRSWLKASNNFLVILEEIGGNPLGISVKLHSASIVCAQVSQSYYPPMQKLLNASLLGQQEVFSNDMIPEMNLRCRDGKTISSITFASFGTPGGSCQSFSRGNCHAPSSKSIVSKACLGKRSCSVKISNDVFGGDPCQDVVKTLSVEARCTSPSLIVPSNFEAVNIL